jgi:hypothetical protein
MLKMNVMVMNIYTPMKCIRDIQLANKGKERGMIVLRYWLVFKWKEKFVVNKWDIKMKKWSQVDSILDVKTKLDLIWQQVDEGIKQRDSNEVLNKAWTRGHLGHDLC